MHTATADDATLGAAPPSEPSASRPIVVGDRVIPYFHQQHGIAVVTELSTDDTVDIRVYGNNHIHCSVHVSQLQLALPPAPSSPMLDLIVPPDSKQPEDMTLDELVEALYSLGDQPELCEVLQQAKTWRADRHFEDANDRYDRYDLAGCLCYFRDKLRLGFGIAITPGDVTIAEMEGVVLLNDSLVADALHDAGVDFGRYELTADDGGYGGFLNLHSFISEACGTGKLGMAKKAISWGAYSEASVIASAYFAVLQSDAIDNATSIMTLLVSECGLDVNFDPKLSANEDVKRFFEQENVGFATLLNSAVENKDIEVTKVLLDRGAIVDCVKGNAILWNSPLKIAVNKCCNPSTTNDDRSDFLEIIDLLLRHGARMRTKASDTEEEHCMNNILKFSVYLMPSYDSSGNLAALTKLLHVGKPDASVVEEAIQYTTESRSPVSNRLISDYLRGKPFCCDVCEKLTNATGGKLLVCPCRTIAYCGKECQTIAWKEHKLVCGDKLGANGMTEALVKKRELRKSRSVAFKGLVVLVVKISFVVFGNIKNIKC
jgi:hypothetical protein